jgi:hypothetical protein
MVIKELRILPPLAFARLGSAAEPLDNYTVEVVEDPVDPLDNYRQIKPAATLVVDETTGEVTAASTPSAITFKQDGRIRPVAPFLEVFAVTGKDKLEPLTVGLLQRAGLEPANVSWRVVVANRKVVRRTDNERDLVAADTQWFSGHEPQPLRGYCKNFISSDRFIDLGRVRYLKPNEKFPGIRLRFTPAHGLIYGPRLKEKDPLISHDRAIYDVKKGSWYEFQVIPPQEPGPGSARGFQDETMPPSLFAIKPPAPPWLHDDKAISRGYLDDACDGFVEVALTLRNGKQLIARSRIVSAPPLLVPDSFMVRTLADEFDQIIHGPTVSKTEPPEVTRARAEDIIRRAYETVHFLNVEVMNGDDVGDRAAEELDTMPAEEAFGTQRMMRPIFDKKSGRTNTLAALEQHRIAFQWIREGNATLILPYLRQPDEVADYTDTGRRKMPALMCGADNNYLALTHRQIDTIRKTATGKRTRARLPARPSPQLTPRNVSAQLYYEGAGNPLAVRPVTSVGNCIPGLEMDFRAVWRRLFKGIVLREYDNLVVAVDPDLRNAKKRRLKGHRLLRVAGIPVLTQMRGPSAERLHDDYERAPANSTVNNPYAVAPLEWSNALADVLHKYQGKKVRCDFTKSVAWNQQQPWRDDPGSYVSFDFTVRHFFEDETAVISRALADAGELTQGLCSPWQNDYRECSCYYWASARPDFVNVDSNSQGDNWMQKERTGEYVPDDYVDKRLILFEDILSPDWEKWFRFQVGGKDAEPAMKGTEPPMKDPVAPISTPLTRKSTSKEASFERDIKPLFLPQDVQCMRARNVFLGDYEFMKVPQNARMVLARLSGEQTPRMPEGGPYWGRRQLRLFRTWIRQGLKP